MSGEIRCPVCLDSGYMCENHQNYPWDVVVEGHRPCGGAGMPCRVCCSPIPEDGTNSIVEAFVPDWKRQELAP